MTVFCPSPFFRSVGVSLHFCEPPTGELEVVLIKDKSQVSTTWINQRAVQNLRVAAACFMHKNRNICIYNVYIYIY